MRRVLELIRSCLLASSLLLLVFATDCYWGRFDFCTAVTVFPPWCWFGSGLILLSLGWAIGRHGASRKPATGEDDEEIDLLGRSEHDPNANKVSLDKPSRASRIAVVLLGAWFVFLLVFADSPISLARGWLPAPALTATYRVVTFNCMSSSDALEEVIAAEPDIVLLQESCGRADLDAVADRMYGPGEHVCRGPDASIIARGNIECVDVPQAYRENFVHARVKTEEVTIDVISLRLIPSVFRLDLWSPSCWAAFQHNREQRRRQMAAIVSYLATIPEDRVVIVGGDFNAPPGDAIFRLLRPHFTDAFAVAGRGWGGTITSNVPVIRIDQIWTSGAIDAVRAIARKSQHSDHRMVVVDFRNVD